MHEQSSLLAPEPSTTKRLNAHRNRYRSAMTAIRVATIADLERVSQLLARAFADDPFFDWVLKSGPSRPRRLHMWSEAAARGSVAMGETNVTADYSGAALWTPPGDHSTDHALVRWWRLIPRAGVVGALRLGPGFDLLDAATPTVPHVYFRILGVEPSRQGTGIGSRLIEHGLERWAPEHLPTYLFSTKERNVPLYERYGFKVVERLDLPGGPSVWPMWRDSS